MSQNLYDKLSNVVKNTTNAKRGLTSPEDSGNQQKKQGKSTSSHSKSANMAAKQNKAGDNWQQSFDQIHEMNKKILLANQELKDEMHALREEVHDMKTSITYLSSKYDEHEREIGQLKQENKLLKKELSAQFSRLEELDQYGRRQNVLIDRIKEQSSENTNEIVSNVCNSLGIELDKGDLQVSHRLGKPRSNFDKPRPIIARFTNVATARAVVHAAKAKGKENKSREKQNGNAATSSMKPVDVWVREHLTDHKSSLLQECLKLKREKTLHACWVYNHAVFAKHMNDTKGTKISSMEDLHKFINK